MSDTEDWRCPKCNKIYAVDKEIDFSQGGPNCFECNINLIKVYTIHDNPLVIGFYFRYQHNEPGERIELRGSNKYLELFQKRKWLPELIDAMQTEVNKMKKEI